MRSGVRTETACEEHLIAASQAMRTGCFGSSDHSHRSPLTGLSVRSSFEAQNEEGFWLSVGQIAFNWDP